jgi:hypothetical protein
MRAAVGVGFRRRQRGVSLEEGAEESLSILPDYAPTVRPRPSAVDHLDRDMLQRLTCSRIATSCVWFPMCTSGSLRAEWGWVTAVDGAQQFKIWAGTTVSLEERHGQAAV